MVLDVVENQYN